MFSELWRRLFPRADRVGQLCWISNLVEPRAGELRGRYEWKRYRVIAWVACTTDGGEPVAVVERLENGACEWWSVVNLRFCKEQPEVPKRPAFDMNQSLN